MAKIEHFLKAKDLLESNDDSMLVHAALEFRLCLEAIVYEKLRTYAKRLPDEIKRKWQPPQALKALLALEPDADQDFRAYIAPEGEHGERIGDWQPLGAHSTVRYKWLQKHYNKLGSWIHYPMPFEKPKYPYKVQLKKMREELEKMASEIEPAARSGFDASMAQTVDFECEVCHQPVVCNEMGLERTGRAVCLNPECNVEYIARREANGEGWIVQIPSVAVACTNCKETMYVQRRILNIEDALGSGTPVACVKCKAKHRVRLSLIPEVANNEKGS